MEPREPLDELESLEHPEKTEPPDSLEPRGTLVPPVCPVTRVDPVLQESERREIEVHLVSLSLYLDSLERRETEVLPDEMVYLE